MSSGAVCIEIDEEADPNESKAKRSISDFNLRSVAFLFGGSAS